VAQLAGVPQGVLRRAREILARLESEHARPAAAQRVPEVPPGGGAAAAPAALDELRREVAAAPVETLTPIDAMNELARLRDRARSIEDR
jgi:DNA mismatch repair protein MutS